ncbi:MAG: UDP-N-acetylmuramoyl-L-alanine--D-glutamate ligase [Lachnospiraceae bacterium]|nr:UDP-N-acetylmuramoyl-L-alanine--D-glutamate ligase [Lachnospiraceae bacterium]
MNGKRILIWGYGREGKSTERFLERCCKPASVGIFEGKREEIREEDYDLIIKSPGIIMKEDHPKYTSQTELFLEEFRDRVIGVTGTKGKSTTSAMLQVVLSACSGRNVILLGNIGLPCLDYFEQITRDTVVVYEMSCHQLAHTRVSPHIAVFLNLYEEHLDYYGTVEAYFAAKSNITRYQKEGDYVFLGDNVPYIETKAERIVLDREKHCRYQIHIMGEHNQYNAEFVHEIAVKLFGCDEAAVMESLKGFEGLPHRLQYIGEKGGVRYYDDSISTIPEAAISAVNSIPKVQTILIGGMDRKINYDILIAFIRERRDIRFICAYASGKRIYDAVGDCDNCFYREDLKQAVELAKQITQNGRACVLSPAAASYGYFKNFEERGDAFRRLVMEGSC